MKILIVSSYFPPANSIASLRPYSWAKWWAKAGHNVTVLTTKKSQEPNELKLDCSGFHVLSVKLWMPFRKASNVVKNDHAQSMNKKKSVVMSFLNYMKGLYSAFSTKTGCFNACRYPDWHDGWARSALKLVKNSSWDLVISTGWPYSVHRIGLALKKQGKATKWVVDWRDLWTKNHIYPGLALFHHIEESLESAFHESADLITTVSDPLAEILRGMTNTQVETIYNGFDPEDFTYLLQEKRKANQKLEIVYTGTIYKKYQDPSPLFESVGRLLKNGDIAPEDIHITFAGNQADVEELAKKYGMERVYTYAGFISREQALSMQYNADIVLFLEYAKPEVKGILTGKLFEYLYLAREIWAVGCTENTETGELIEQSNAGIAFGLDVKRIMETILTRIDSLPIDARIKNTAIIEKYDRKRQAMRLLEMVKP